MKLVELELILGIFFLLLVIGWGGAGHLAEGAVEILTAAESAIVCHTFRRPVGMLLQYPLGFLYAQHRHQSCQLTVFRLP